MYLTKPQWEAIRQIAAEQARKIINEEHDVNPSWVAALNFGFDPTQLTEVTRIAGCTARKTINQHAWRDQCLQEEYKKNEALTSQVRGLIEKGIEREQAISSIIAQNVALNEEVIRLQGEADQLRRDLGSAVAANRRHMAVQAAIPRPRDGDRWTAPDGTLMTFFRGEWRRRSEMEGFASAAKYL